MAPQPTFDRRAGNVGTGFDFFVNQRQATETDPGERALAESGNALRGEQFKHLGIRKSVSRKEGSSIVHGIGGEDGRTLDQELKKRLWGEDPTRLVHVDEPPAGASEAEAHAFYEQQRRMLFGSL